MAVEWFKDNDVGYLAWCERHPEGYVANARRKISSNYLVLHQANCLSVTEHPDMKTKPGGFTARQYSKVCAESELELRAELQRRTGNSEPLSGVCRCVKVSRK